MTFHRSTLGCYGAYLPANTAGYVTCSSRRVAACRAALEAGREAPRWADTGANAAVARAEIAIDAWRG